MDINNDVIRAVIKEVLAEYENQNTGVAAAKVCSREGVMSIDAGRVKCRPYNVGYPADVKLMDLVSVKESPNMGCGILEITKSTYPWRLTGYEEFYYVVDGELDVITETETIRGKSGQILFIPKDSSIKFSAPESCRAIYFTYPADWENS